jgi:hypothetical protein
VIRIAVEGADAQEIDGGGDLLVRVGGATLRQRRPVAYQETGAERQPVAAAFALDGGTLGFALGPHDPARPLVIDPVLVYSTYLGASGRFSSDHAYGVAVDAAGSAYVVGSTLSPDFPSTPGAFQPTFRGGPIDGFVAKLNPTGTALVYATYLGGTDYDAATSIAVDAAGNAYVAGVTESADFPTTPGAPQPAHRLVRDAFVAKLNPTGTALVYATYLGGNGDDGATSIALDAAASAYVVGYTYSSDLHTTPGALQPAPRGDGDAFVAKLNPAGTALLYATYLGGKSADGARGIAVDAAGAAYVTGFTYSPDFPTTPGALEPAHRGGFTDVFVAKLNPAGTALLYATYLGGRDAEDVGAIAVDAGGRAYVAGFTLSPDFPTTPGALQPARRGELDAFVAKLNPAGTALVYATYLGGTAQDIANGIAVDAAGASYVTGYTYSHDFPTMPGAPQPAFAGGSTDVFVAKLNPAGTALVYSTYLGGTAFEDIASGIAVDAAGGAYVVGDTPSPDFPTTPGALQRTQHGARSGFVAKLSPAPTYAELCSLSRQFSADAALAEAMCRALEAAQTAERLGSASGKATALAGYGRLVAGAQAAGALTAQQAGVLTTWAARL